MKVFVDVTYTDNVALALLPVASTRTWALPAAYSANWIETVSVATGVGVALDGIAVAVGVAVGLAGTGVAVGVTVEVGSGGASRLISNSRTDDQALFIPPAVRARTRHQKRRSLVKVCVVWVWASPV